MPTYGISMPIAGFIYKEVEADSEEQAKELFYQSDITNDDIESWDTHEHIVTGNVFHGELNDMEIEEV